MISISSPSALRPASPRRCCSPSISSGSALAMVLFFVAPLPILIAGAGLAPLCRPVAAVAAAAACLALALPPIFAGWPSSLGIGLPAWCSPIWRCSRRPSADGDVEWYPLGRLLVWSAVVAAAGVAIGARRARPRRGEHHGGAARRRRAACCSAPDRHAGRPAADAARRRGPQRRGAADGDGAAAAPRAMVSMLTALLNLWGAAQRGARLRPAGAAVAGPHRHRACPALPRWCWWRRRR